MCARAAPQVGRGAPSGTSPEPRTPLLVVEPLRVGSPCARSSCATPHRGGCPTRAKRPSRGPTRQPKRAACHAGVGAGRSPAAAARRLRIRRARARWRARAGAALFAWGFFVFGAGRAGRGGAVPACVPGLDAARRQTLTATENVSACGVGHSGIQCRHCRCSQSQSRAGGGRARA